MRKFLSPYIVLTTDAEVAAMVDLAARFAVPLYFGYDGSPKRPGTWYWYTQGKGFKNNALFHHDECKEIIKGLISADRIPTPTNSVSHFISSARRQMLESS